jgi:hypothetical protein
MRKMLRKEMIFEMITLRYIFLFLISPAFLVSCGSATTVNNDDSAQVDSLHYSKELKLLSCSDPLKNALIEFTLDSSRHILIFNLYFHADSVSFPRCSNCSGQWPRATMNAEILNADGTSIPAAGGGYGRSGHAYPIGKDDVYSLFGEDLKMETSFIDMDRIVGFTFEVPCLALSQLPDGKNNLKIHLWQENLQYRIYPGEEQSPTDTIIKSKLFECTGSFTFYREPVYKTTLTCKKLMVATPDSMTWDYGDGDGPDIYWRAWHMDGWFFPQTTIHENQTELNFPTAVSLYYYHPSDSILLQVWDKDGDTEDDHIGTYVTTVGEIPVGKEITLAFDSVNVFILERKDD